MWSILFPCGAASSHVEYPGKWRQAARYRLSIHPAPNPWSTMRNPVGLTDLWKAPDSLEHVFWWRNRQVRQIPWRAGRVTDLPWQCTYPFLFFPLQSHQRPQPWPHRFLGRGCSSFKLGIKCHSCLSLYFLFPSCCSDSDWETSICNSLLIASLSAGSFSLPCVYSGHGWQVNLDEMPFGPHSFCALKLFLTPSWLRSSSMGDDTTPSFSSFCLFFH